MVRVTVSIRVRVSVTVRVCHDMFRTRSSLPSRRCLMGLLQLRFELDSATTRYEVFRALAYEIVYENQW